MKNLVDVLLSSIIILSNYAWYIQCNPVEGKQPTCVALKSIFEDKQYLSRCTKKEIDVVDEFLCTALGNLEKLTCTFVNEPNNASSIALYLNQLTNVTTQLNRTALCNKFKKQSLITDKELLNVHQNLKSETCEKLCAGEESHSDKLCVYIYSMYEIISKLNTAKTDIKNAEAENSNPQPVQNTSSVMIATAHDKIEISQKAVTEITKNKESDTVTIENQSENKKNFQSSKPMEVTVKTAPAIKSDTSKVSPGDNSHVISEDNTSIVSVTTEKQVVSSSQISQVMDPPQQKKKEEKIDISPTDATDDQYPGYLEEEEPNFISEKEITNNNNVKINILPEEKLKTDSFIEAEDSNFFSYFMFISLLFIIGYVIYHNKQKVFALLLEGRKERGARRRPNTAGYRKLNSNLEEAVTSKCSGSASHVIY